MKSPEAVKSLLTSHRLLSEVLFFSCCFRRWTSSITSLFLRRFWNASRYATSKQEKPMTNSWKTSRESFLLTVFQRSISTILYSSSNLTSPSWSLKIYSSKMSLWILSRCLTYFSRQIVNVRWRTRWKTLSFTMMLSTKTLTWKNKLPSTTKNGRTLKIKTKSSIDFHSSRFIATHGLSMLTERLSYLE